MKFHLNIIGPVLLASFCLLLYGLSGEAAWSASSPAGHTDTESCDASAGVYSNVFDQTAALRSGNGVPLSEGGVRISVGGASAEYPLADGGQIHLSGLSRQEGLQLCLMDPESRELGRTEVHVSTGAVIDASTDQEGVGYVILRSDTKEVNLIFTLREGGFLQCSLLLTSQE